MKHPLGIIERKEIKAVVSKYLLIFPGAVLGLNLQGHGCYKDVQVMRPEEVPTHRFH